MCRRQETARGVVVMKTCPRCATVAVGASMKCRQCGALLVAPPMPAPATVPSPAAAATGPAAEERFFAPATFTPVVTSGRAHGAEKRRVPVVPIVAGLVVVACAVAAYATVGSGSGGHPSKAPTALPSIDESQGLPNLADAVRIQAEAARQRAFSVVGQASAGASGAPLDAQTLRSLDPSLEWVHGEDSSTGPGVVSFSQSADGVIVAVSTRRGNVCAFGWWSPEAAGRFVTLGNVSACRAVDAPATGWAERSEAGGGSRYAPPDGY